MSKAIRVRAVKANPKKIITILLAGALATLMVVAVPLVGLLHQTLLKVNGKYHTLHQTLRLIRIQEDEIKQVLARAAFDRDSEAAKDYGPIRRSLDREFGELIQNSGDDYIVQNSALDLSQRNVDAIEARVIELVLSDRYDEALIDLQSGIYREGVRERARLIGTVERRVETLIAESLGTLRMIVYQGMAVIATLMTLMLGIWFKGLRTFNEYEAERNAVEIALRESQERFSALIENLPVGVYRLTPGPDGKFIAANVAMARIFGYASVDEFLTCDPRKLYANQDERKALSRELLENGRVRDFHVQLYRKDGSKLWGSISANVIRDSLGKILYVDGMEEDISERRQAEENLIASEERYRLLAQNTQDVIWLADINLQLTYMSPAIEDLLGYNVSEALALRLEDMLTAEGFTQARRTLQAAFRRVEKDAESAKQHTIRLETQMRRKNGELRWVEVNMVMLRNKHGRVVGIQGSTRDAQKRKQAELALLKSERLYRGIIETTDEGVWMLDRDNRTTLVNAKLCEMLGCDPGDIMGREYFEFMDEESQTIARVNDEKRRAGLNTRADLRFRRKDQGHFWAMVSASPVFDSPGEYGGTLIMLSDITARKRAEETIRESEERYRLLAENARDVIITTDMALNLTYVSPAVEALTGYTSRDVANKQLKDLLTPESFGVARQVFSEEMELEFKPGRDLHRSRTLELELYAKDSHRVWTEIKVSFLRDPAERPIGIQGSLRDITERRRVEQALRTSEELYRGIIETTDEGVWILDANDRTTFVNGRMAQMLGYRVEEVTGRRINDFLDEVGHQIYRANDHHRRKGLKTHNDLKLVRKDGTDLWAIVSASPSFTDDGQYTGALAMLSDITERKRAEEGSRILAAVSSLFLAGKDIGMAINTVLEMCGEFDGADRAFVYLCDRTSKRFGCTHEWCKDGIRSHQSAAIDLSTTDYEWLIGQLERGQSVVISNMDNTPTALRDFLREAEVRSRITFPIFILGQFEGFCGFDSVTRQRDWTASDMSVLRQTAELVARGIERKRAEEALRNSESLYTSLVEHLEQAVVRKDRQGRITFANSKYCTLTRLTLEKIIGHTAMELYPGDLAKQVHENDLRVMESGVPYESVDELKIGRARTIHLHVLKTPVRDAQGKIVGLQAVMWDISKQKQTEEALLAASRLEATATLAGGIAHDFNNLMVGILGNAEILQFKLAEREDLQKRLKTIATAARRGGDLAHQLLDFARGSKTQTTQVNLAHTIEEALQIQHRAVPPMLEVETITEPNLWIVKADPVQMTQVVMNLCINAIEAVEGPGKITIRATNVMVDEGLCMKHPTLKPGPHVHLSVADTGSGMSSDVIARVFEPFFTTKFQGRGLGLAAVYGIVRNHHGWIGVDSEAGKGTTFNVYLPAMEIEKSESAQNGDAPTEAPATILLVDDEEMILDVNRMLLEHVGYRIDVAHNAAEALRVLQDRGTDIQLVILDMTLPDMPGRDLFFRIREVAPQVRVLLYSGNPQDTISRDLLRHGAVGYLAKPVKGDVLTQEVRRALQASVVGRV